MNDQWSHNETPGAMPHRMRPDIRAKEMRQRINELADENMQLRIDAINYRGRISGLEAALKSATPVYQQTSDTLAEMVVVIEPRVMYYRIEPDVFKAALEPQR